MFSFEALDGAKASLKKLFDKVLELKGKGKANNNYLKQFTLEINDDLNTPRALATMWEVLKDEKLSAGDKYSTLLGFDKVLGLGLKDLKVDKIPQEIIKLAEQRLQARNNKDWKKADELREKITKFGYIVEDTKEGYELKKE